MTDRSKVAVFGGTGFLGRCIVRHLADRHTAVRVVSRHPERGAAIFRGREGGLELVTADINEDRSVAAAIAGATAVVNAVSLYAEGGGHTFRSVHVDGAARLARAARDSGVARLLHVSGIGADPRSSSPYSRSRGQGEDAVRGAFPSATIVRPAVMFGRDDAFLQPHLAMLRRSPAFPLFGRGETRLQPAYVEDVAEACARALQAPNAAVTYELGGPRVYTYRELLRLISSHLGVERALVPVPFALWRPFAFVAEMLPRPPLTRNQVELMMVDNVASPARPGFASLGIEPHDLEPVLAAMALSRPEQRHERVSA